MTFALKVTAQTLTTLHSFTNTPDGAYPLGGMILSGNALYGTTQKGGLSGAGMVFKINTDGTGLTNLFSFPTLTGLSNSDGAYPGGVLVLSGNTLYGATALGGSNGNGAVFRINTDGTSFTNLHSFTTLVSGTNSDGGEPVGALVLSGNTLYGTASQGGSAGDGIVFGINTDGTGLTNHHNFTGGDGESPEGPLVLSGNTLYGSTSKGGAYTWGTVFRINTDGTAFTNLFSLPSGNAGGAVPEGALVVSGNVLYGTTYLGGGPNYGTVFRINNDGTHFTNLLSFNGSGDGAYLPGGLVMSGNTLYGTTIAEIGTVYGTVFSIDTDGTGFTSLHNFSATSGSKSTNIDGAVPLCVLTYSSNILYGMGNSGGTSGYGTLFSISLPRPLLTISAGGTNVILRWTNTAPGFKLESTTNLCQPTWSTNLPAPVVVNGQNVVTNSIYGTQQFYELSQ